jgi:hypothetical protein
VERSDGRAFWLVRQRHAYNPSVIDHVGVDEALRLEDRLSPVNPNRFRDEDQTIAWFNHAPETDVLQTTETHECVFDNFDVMGDRRGQGGRSQSIAPSRTAGDCLDEFPRGRRGPWRCRSSRDRRGQQAAFLIVLSACKAQRHFAREAGVRGSGGRSNRRPAIMTPSPTGDKGSDIETDLKTRML